VADLGQTIDFIKQYLDARVANHSLRASNVANAETPNYRALVPSFQVRLDQQMRAPEPGLFSAVGPALKVDMKVAPSSAPGREDGNNVQLEKEMSELAQNSLQYATAYKILSKQMAIARYAISSGR